MARYLVTGAAGFVGPHLREALQAQAHEVWTTDRSPLPPPAGAPVSVTGAPSSERPAPPRHERCDLTDSTAVQQLVERVRPAAIFHLASRSSVAQSFAQPQEVLQTNIVATCNVLEAVRRVVPDARVLVVGSAEQYGNVPAAQQPIPETQPFRPASPYAVSKVAQEYLALQYADAYGLDVVLARSFNHSGPGQSDRFVLPAFARQIAEIELGRREALLRVGNLDVWRDFLDVRDVVRAYALLVQQGEARQAYNVCRGETYRVRDLLDQLLGMARAALRVEPDPARMRASDLPVLRGDASRLRTATGWEPRLTMPDTLRDVLDDWRLRLAEGEGS